MWCLPPQANISELASLELFVSLEGVGLSLINTQYEEVAYVSLYCRPAKWEVETKPDRWKSLNMELSSILEDKHRIGQSIVTIEESVEVSPFQTPLLIFMPNNSNNMHLYSA